MTSFARFEQLCSESARVRTRMAAKTERPLHDDSVDREGGKTWSGNFYHIGRTAFQVRHRKADHGGGTGHGRMVLQSTIIVQTNIVFASQLTPHGPV